jgi:hypothetical protein
MLLISKRPPDMMHVATRTDLTRARFVAMVYLDAAQFVSRADIVHAVCRASITLAVASHQRIRLDTIPAIARIDLDPSPIACYTVFFTIPTDAIIAAVAFIFRQTSLEPRLPIATNTVSE